MNREVAFSYFDVRGDGSLYLGNSVKSDVDIPDACPMCKVFGLHPILSSYALENPGTGFCDLVAAMFCLHCRKPFLAAYHSGERSPYSVEPSSVPSRAFDPAIQALSPRFVEAYNQALAAESLSLSELTGMGYRRALEFLVKDYLIHCEPDKAESIRAEALGSCIHNRISEPRLQTTAQSATWLGNDFTHYERRYSEYDVEHLKRFIDAVAYWVLMGLHTEQADSLDRR